MRDINNNDDKSHGKGNVRVQDSAHIKGKYSGDQTKNWSTAGGSVSNPLGVREKGMGFGKDHTRVMDGNMPQGTPRGAYRHIDGPTKKKLSY